MKIHHSSFAFFAHELALANMKLETEINQNIEHYLAASLKQSILDTDNIPSNNQITEFLDFVPSELVKSRCVADSCLIIAGMFPQRCLHLGGGDLLPIIWVGTQAYYLEFTRTKIFIFSELSNNFIACMDIMLVMNYCLKPFVLPNKAMTQLSKIGSRFPNYLAMD